MHFGPSVWRPVKTLVLNMFQETVTMNFDSWFLVQTNTRLIWLSKQWKLPLGDSAITMLSQGIWAFLMLIRGADTFQFGTISTISSRGGIFYIFNITLENDIRVFRNITKSSSWSFHSFPLSQKYSLWGFVDQRKLLSRDKQEIVPNPAGFALLSNQLSKSTSGNFPFMKIWLWRESLLFVCRKKVFANQRSWWGRSRMIGSDYPIVGLFSGSAELRIASD